MNGCMSYWKQDFYIDKTNYDQSKRHKEIKCCKGQFISDNYVEDH